MLVYQRVPYDTIHQKLLGGWALPLWKMMDLKSVGMIFHSHMESHNPVMFQTTNQYIYIP